MALSLCFSPIISCNSTEKPGLISQNYTSRKANWIVDATYSSKNAAFEVLKATNNKSSTKPNSLLCAECDGNGTKKCRQCQGTGVNSVDHFDGQFKAGSTCWLCSIKSKSISESTTDALESKYPVVWGHLFVGRVHLNCSTSWGKREILCGNCNGAGFVGGFLSALED